MKAPHLKIPRMKKWNYSALAFAMPFFGMLFIMLVSQYQPFGQYSMLYSDMYHQYYPFFVAFREALRSGDSLLYNWSVGMGMDYLGLISYYLASPLNLVSVLIPESWLLGFFSLLMPIKLGLAGLFFALFLKNIFGKDDFSISVFGSLYALCAWALGYQWNIMWLDTFALLPLAALGTVRLLKDKKFILYTAALFFSIYANYYIGLFTCIFIGLLFFCYEICRFRGWKRFFQDLGRIALFSVLAIGMTAILEFPAVAALGATQSSVNKFPTSFRLNMTTDHTFLGLLDVMRRVTGNLGGGLEPTFKEGLPNLYCGVGTLLLAVLYMTARDVKLRDKLCALSLLLFFNLSFIIRQLDYIWHGFHFTNMIPYRFSFLYSFVLLYMAYRAWLSRRSFRPLQIGMAGVITAALLCCSEALLEMKSLDLGFTTVQLPLYIIYNGGFLALYLGAFFYGALRRRLPAEAQPEEIRERKMALCQRRVYARIIVLAVTVVELGAMLLNFGVTFTGTNVSNYPRGKEETASMIRYMKEREARTPFYRAETTHSQTLNDGALNGYYGISTFTSSANVKVTEFMKALGYGAKNTYNRYCFEESSPVANLFLDLKYMIERSGQEKGSTFFTDIHHFGQVHLLENNAYLPLGFLAESSLADVDFDAPGAPFQFQDTLLAAAAGMDRPVWHVLPDSTLELTGENITVTPGMGGQCSYSNADSKASITYAYVADRDGFCCIHLDLPKRNDFVVTVNGAERMRENISLPQMLAVGDVYAGDVVQIIISCDQGEQSTAHVQAAILNGERFWEAYEHLNASTLNLTSFRNTRLEGDISCDRDGLLYTSIPQNGNWSVQVDGQPADIQLVGDVMIGVPLTRGEHQLSFRYRNPAFCVGWKVSLACLGIFGGLVYFDRRKKLSPKA